MYMRLGFPEQFICRVSYFHLLWKPGKSHRKTDSEAEIIITEPTRRQKGSETGSRMKQATMTPLILASLSLTVSLWDLALIPKFLSRTFPGWFVGMCCYPPVELIYYEFYLPPHLDITEVIITTLYMPVHPVKRHIHQTPVAGNSFINDQIHFCWIAALWCMRRRADAWQTDTRTERLIPQGAKGAVLSVFLWWASAPGDRYGMDRKWNVL